MPHLENNLAALAANFPELAAILQQTPVPKGFTPTAGTDGTATFARIHTTDGKKRVEWLGATSMPAASALPIVAALDPLSKGANGLGLAMGTGFEWAAFIAKLNRSQLLYVYEPDAAILRMALEICDLSALLAKRRMILLTGAADAAAHDLAGFLAANLGFDPPTVLHPLPTAADRRNTLLTAGETIVRHAVSERQARLTQLEQRIITALSRSRAAEAPVQTFGLLLTPRYAAERPIQTEAVSRGASAITLDHHTTTSLALRLQRLVELLDSGPVHILSDLCRQQLAPIPDEVPIETWIPPFIGPGYWERLPPGATFARHDRIVVHFGGHAERLQAHGIPANQIILRLLTPPKIDNRKSKIENPRRLALIADLPPSDEAALGIELPTHQAVYAAACAFIRTDYLTVHPGMAPDILRRALARAGVDSKIDDPSLKESMLRVIREVLIAALPPRTLVAALAREGFPLTLLGDWPGLQTSLADIRMIPFETYTPAAWDDVALCIHFSPQGTFSPILWDALLAHAPIVAPQHPADSFPGSLPQLLIPDTQFAYPLPKNLSTTIKALLRDAPRREKLAAAARQHISYDFLK